MVASNPHDIPAATTPAVGLSLMLENDFRDAALPLLEAGEVEVLEWSFDVGWSDNPVPEWLDPLLDFFAMSDRLLGHGVTFSPLSGRWHARQDWWLAQLKRECARHEYHHLSEHFGFMTAGSFHQSAPLPVPMNKGSLRVGRDRLRRLADVSGKTVGLENLAFAFGLEDVKRQGEFLDALLAPVDGLLVLDLHNLHCQCCNFHLAHDAILDQYPLARVRELHVSGGSWSASSVHAEPIRRDTHDGPVPPEVYDLLALALRRCPRVESVIFERLGGTIHTADDANQFRHDFRSMRNTVKGGRDALA